MTNALFGVKHETRCLVEIMDIQDELTMVKSVLAQQKEVLEHLAKSYPKAAGDDDEKNEWAILKRLFPSLSSHAGGGGGHVLPHPQPTEPGAVRLSRQVVENLDANEADAQLQIEQEARENTRAPVDNNKKRLNLLSETETLVPDSQSQLSATEMPVLTTRHCLEGAIDLVDGNITSVDHMLQHASKVQDEVYTP